jgi:hypothetical protein
MITRRGRCGQAGDHEKGKVRGRWAITRRGRCGAAGDHEER